MFVLVQLVYQQVQDQEFVVLLLQHEFELPSLDQLEHHTQNLHTLSRVGDHVVEGFHMFEFTQDLFLLTQFGVLRVFIVNFEFLVFRLLLRGVVPDVELLKLGLLFL